MGKIKVEWVVCEDAGATAHCLRCGRKQTVKLPMMLSAWCAAMKEFVKLHKGCKER